MTETHIDGALLRRMFITGAALLEKQKAAIDALNVFPVPDGDTGTNMSMTLSFAVKELRASTSANACDIAAAAAAGALRGARGNSGVILSQLFRGFARACKDAPILNLETFAKALGAGVDAAYKAVTKPKEGTLLTVARVVAESVTKAVEDGAHLTEILNLMVKSASDAVAKTPSQLPVLKEAGVVDAGGKGLFYIYIGFNMAFHGEAIPEDFTDEEASDAPLFDDSALFEENKDLDFAYCTELFIQRLKDNVDDSVTGAFREKMESIGDSVVAIFDDDLIKVHVHTNEPGTVLQAALELGELGTIKIDNMLEQQREMVARRKASEKEFGIVAVSAGEGFERVFKDLMVDEVISGGQTMNPSAEDIAEAIKKVHARTVYVFPNNKNIILAARQAREFSTKNVIVIPTRSLPEGVAGILAYHPDASREENELRMNQALKQVKSGSVTRAVRDTRFNGFFIKKDDFIGLLGDDIVCCGKECQGVAAELLDKMLGDDGELVTLFFGAEATEDQANELVHGVLEKRPECDCIVQSGGQPLYHYIFSVE